MPNQGKDYVKNIESKDGLDSSLRDLQEIDSFEFNKFDENIENSFQTFLDKNASQFSETATKETLQPVFNARLDNQYADLDSFKADEIAKKIIVPTTFELQNFNTLVELENFQQQMSHQKDATKTNVEITLIDGNDLKFDLFNKNQISKDDIVKELNKDFKDRDKIIGLLEKGDLESVRQVQYILIGENYEKKAIKNGYLQIHGTDGKFGKETFDALKNYVENNKITTTSTGATGSQTPGTTGSTGGIETQSIGTGTTGPQAPGTTGSTGGIETQSTSIDNTVNYGFENYYSCSVGEEIPLTTVEIPNASSVEIEPPYAGNANVSLKDGKIQYNSTFDGQDSFTLVVKDLEGNIIHSKDIIIEIKNNDNNVETYKTPISKADEVVDKLRKETNLDTRKKEIKTKLDGLKSDYEKYDKQKENSPEKATAIQEIPVITKAVLLLEAETDLKSYINNDHGELEKKLNTRTCDYYIGGEYISQEKFLKQLKKDKINKNNLRFVDFDIKLQNYTEIKDYLEKNDGSKINFIIQNLIITDDKNLGEGTGLTKDQEIQYKAERYTGKENIDLKSERRALKRILGIKGIFGWGGVDEDMSIATKDYKTNNPAFREKQNLKKLKKALMDVFKDKDRSVQSLFQEVAKDYNLGIPPRPSQGADKHRQNVYELYKMYKEDKNCGDYFKKVMGLFENYFVRGLDDFGRIDDDGKDVENLFTSIYNQEAIGRTKGLIDPDRKRKAANSIFKGGKNGGNKGGIDLKVTYKTSKELEDLEKLVKKIDLDTYLDDPNASKKHKEFSKLYDKYKDSQSNKIKDNKGNFVVMGEANSDDEKVLYYNAAFDFIVGIVEGRGDIVSAINAIKLTDMMDGAELEGTEKNIFESVEEKKFLMRLADYNRDGRVDHGDRGYVMGLTVKNVYKSAKVDQRHLGGEGQNAPWKNLIEFCKVKMKQDASVALLSDLERIDTDNLEEVFEEMGKNPGLLDYFQSTLANSPMPIDYIFRHGKNASDEYLNFVLPQVESGEFKIEGLDQAFQKEYKKILDQGIGDTPELRAVLKPHFYAGLLESGAIYSAVGGAGLTLDAKKAGQFTMSLGYKDSLNAGENREPVLGVVFAYNNSAKLSENTKISYGAGISSGTGFEKNPIFLPLVYGKFAITNRLNPNVDLKSLERKSAHYFSTGANISWIVGTGLEGLGGGISVGWSRDKMELIDDQSKTIKEALSGSNGILFKSLNGINLKQDKSSIVSHIKQNLAKEFFQKDLNSLSNDDRSTVSKAAENLYSGITYYSTGLDLKENDERLVPIIHEIAEAYAIQRRNDAKFDAKDWHISGAGISVQMLAGFIPIVSVVEFTKYKNLYSKETNQSHANYYERLVTGKGMDFVENADFYDEDGRLTKNAVEYLNAKLGIAHPNVTVPDLYLEKRTKKSESFGKELDVLQIPLDLISRYINVNIDSDVANYTNIIEEDGKKYLQVPANAKIALMDYSRLNTAKFHLIIGDNKVKANDIKVSYNTPNFGGEPLSYERIPDRIDIKKEDVTAKIVEINGDVEGSQHNEKHPFPIKECFKIENNKAVFELKKDFSKKCVNLGGNALNITGDSLTMPHTGTLSIVKDGEKYKLYYRSQPATDLVIDYKISSVEATTQSSENIVETHEGGETIRWIERTSNFENTFDKYEYITDLFNGIEKDLSKMDDNVPALYPTFMDDANSFGVNNVLDESDYEKAFESLKKILSDNKNNSLFNTFSNLKSKIEDTNLSQEEKLMIVDRFKAIFSYILLLTETATNQGKYLETALINKRGDKYKNLQGYDESATYPTFKTEYRKNIVDVLKKEKKLKREEEKNLFGMTAFYRLGNNHDGRSYSMTQMGSTNTLGGIKEKIKDDDLSKAQNWFLANLNKSEIHKKILKETFAEKLGLDNLKKIDDDQLKKLLKGEAIDIDKGGKKTRVKFELDYVFYLLGECANESIGVDLKKAIVSEQIVETTSGDSNTTIVVEETIYQADGHWVGTVIGNKKYSRGLSTGTIDSRAQDEYAKKIQASVAVAGVIDGRQPEPPDNPWSGPNPGTEPDDHPTSIPDSGDDVGIDGDGSSTSSDHIDNLGESGGGHGV